MRYLALLAIVAVRGSVKIKPAEHSAMVKYSKFATPYLLPKGITADNAPLPSPDFFSQFTNDEIVALVEGGIEWGADWIGKFGDSVLAGIVETGRREAELKANNMDLRKGFLKYHGYLTKIVGELLDHPAFSSHRILKKYVEWQTVHILAGEPSELPGNGLGANELAILARMVNDFILMRAVGRSSESDALVTLVEEIVDSHCGELLRTGQATPETIGALKLTAAEKYAGPLYRFGMMIATTCTPENSTSALTEYVEWQNRMILARGNDRSSINPGNSLSFDTIFRLCYLVWDLDENEFALAIQPIVENAWATLEGELHWTIRKVFVTSGSKKDALIPYYRDPLLIIALTMSNPITTLPWTIEAPRVALTQLIEHITMRYIRDYSDRQRVVGYTIPGKSVYMQNPPYDAATLAGWKQLQSVSQGKFVEMSKPIIEHQIRLILSYGAQPSVKAACLLLRDGIKKNPDANESTRENLYWTDLTKMYLL